MLKQKDKKARRGNTREGRGKMTERWERKRTAAGRTHRLPNTSLTQAKRDTGGQVSGSTPSQSREEGRRGKGSGERAKGRTAYSTSP